MNSERKFAEQFLEAQEFFKKIGFKLVDLKDINEEAIFLVKYEVKFTGDFLAAQDFFNKIGLKLIGTKDINNENIYLVKKERK